MINTEYRVLIYKLNLRFVAEDGGTGDGEEQDRLRLDMRPVHGEVL